MNNPDNETYSEAETEARREAALKRLLATPHKPHKKIKDSTRGKTRVDKVPQEDLYGQQS